MSNTFTLRRVLLGVLLVAAAGAGGAALLTRSDAQPPATEPNAARPPAAQPPVAAAKPATSGPNDHTMFGGSPDRNMVNLGGKNVPAKFSLDSDTDVVWKADLGTKSYGGPIVAGGRVYVGTNNGRPRNKRDISKNADGDDEPVDRGVLMAFDEKKGEFQWQMVFDKLPTGMVVDWPHEGICSTPTVEGDKVYLVSNQCRVVCLDAKGLKDGNDGIKTEKYQTPTDGDVLWEYDMIAELKVFPHNMSSCCPLIVGELIYIVTANGVDEGHFNIPSPNAPSFIALNKNTGQFVWGKSYPGRDIMHGQWSNPTYAEIDGVKQIIFPGGDGWLYSLVPETGEVIWKFDCNPKDGVYELGGAGTRNDFIATPVVYDQKVYIAVGQDPEHTDGIGRLWCISPKGKKGDISDELLAGKKMVDGREVGIGKPNPNTGKVWSYGGDEKTPFSVRDFKFGRTMCTACIVDDVLYLGELPGYMHVFNAKTGQHLWQYDTKTAMWGSCYYVDGKVLLGNDNGDLYVWKHEKQQQVIPELDPKAENQKDARAFRLKQRAEIEKRFLLAKIEFDAPIRSTPIVANGVLYVMTEKTLYAVRAGRKD